MSITHKIQTVKGISLEDALKGHKIVTLEDTNISSSQKKAEFKEEKLKKLMEAYEESIDPSTIKHCIVTSTDDLFKQVVGMGIYTFADSKVNKNSTIYLTYREISMMVKMVPELYMGVIKSDYDEEEIYSNGSANKIMLDKEGFKLKTD